MLWFYIEEPRQKSNCLRALARVLDFSGPRFTNHQFMESRYSCKNVLLLLAITIILSFLIINSVFCLLLWNISSLSSSIQNPTNNSISYLVTQNPSKQKADYRDWRKISSGENNYKFKRSESLRNRTVWAIARLSILGLWA